MVIWRQVESRLGIKEVGFSTNCQPIITNAILIYSNSDYELTNMQIKNAKLNLANKNFTALHTLICLFKVIIHIICNFDNIDLKNNSSSLS